MEFLIVIFVFLILLKVAVWGFWIVSLSVWNLISFCLMPTRSTPSSANISQSIKESCGNQDQFECKHDNAPPTSDTPLSLPVERAPETHRQILELRQQVLLMEETQDSLKRQIDRLRLSQAWLTAQMVCCITSCSSHVKLIFFFFFFLKA